MAILVILFRTRVPIVISYTFVLVGLLTCLLLPSTTAYSQPATRSFLSVEVEDSDGRPVADAAVTLSDRDGKQFLSDKTNKDGSATPSFYRGRPDHHYNLQVSSAGYLTSEHVLFVYPSDYSALFLYCREEFPTNGAGHSQAPIKIVLLRTPVTSAERRAVEVEERKRQLLLASKRGDVGSLRKFLDPADKGKSADAADARGIPAIAWAAFAGDAETIKSLLEAGADVRNKNSLGHRVLSIYLTEGIARERNATTETGAIEGRQDIVRRLIAAGAGVNVPTSDGRTPLNIAITQTPASLSVEAIRFLITAGADVNAADGEGQTALMLASQIDSAAIANLLLGAGAHRSVNAKDEKGQTALMYAPRYSDSSSYVVNVLIKARADVNAVNEDGQTALMFAAQAGCVKITNTLLAAGAAINPKDKQGMTALMYSGKSLSADVCKVLIRAGASINEQDAQGWTALMYAAPRYYNDSGSGVVKALITAGAEVDAVNEEGRTALMLAARWYDEEAIKLLLAAGASTSVTDKQGQTALMHACQTMPPIDIDLFLRAGASGSVNAKDSRGWTALMYSVPRYYAAKDAQALIAAGANVNDLNAEGQTALMLAAETGSIEIIKTLLDAGATATINAKDKEGRTALMHVKPKFGFTSVSEIVDALIAAGAKDNASR